MAYILTIALLGFGLVLVFYLAHKYGIIERTIGATEKSVIAAGKGTGSLLNRLGNLISSDGKTRLERKKEKLENKVRSKELKGKLNDLKEEKSRLPEKVIDSNGRTHPNPERIKLEERETELETELEVTERETEKLEERETELEEAGKIINVSSQRELSVINEINEDLTNLEKIIGTATVAKQSNLLRQFQSLYTDKTEILNKAVTNNAALSGEALNALKRYNETGFSIITKLKIDFVTEGKSIKIGINTSDKLIHDFRLLLNSLDQLTSSLKQIKDPETKKTILEFETNTKNFVNKAYSYFVKRIMPNIKKYVSSFETIEKLFDGFLYSLKQEKKYFEQEQIDILEFAKFSSNQLYHLKEISNALQDLEQPKLEFTRQIAFFLENTKQLTEEYKKTLTKLTAL
ncbi:hypothetical protein J4436_03425 [Candidatus Woesearchaeota archaeon]|nr:hypothetical protein [Candidatus Woesearchaeota archaeon]